MTTRSSKKDRDAAGTPGPLAATDETAEQELAAVKAAFARRQTSVSPPRLKIAHQQNGKISLLVDHPDEGLGHALLMTALGSIDADFYDGLLNGLLNAIKEDGEVSEGRFNFALSVIRSIAPRDELEAMLAAQMATVHLATMTLSRRLAHVQTLPQQDGAERAFNKLARTFVSQMEALKRYRTGGHQRVTVEHVTVNSGGQAIVGAVNHAGGGGAEKHEEQPHAPEP